MVRKIVFYLLSIEFPVFDFLQVYGNFMERGREEFFIEFQDCVKMVWGWEVVPGAFGGEFRDKEKMSGDGKLARFFAKKMAGDVYEFQV